MHRGLTLKNFLQQSMKTLRKRCPVNNQSLDSKWQVAGVFSELASVGLAASGEITK
jgi:hypothetical protein